MRLPRSSVALLQGLSVSEGDRLRLAVGLRDCEGEAVWEGEVVGLRLPVAQMLGVGVALPPGLLLLHCVTLRLPLGVGQGVLLGVGGVLCEGEGESERAGLPLPLPLLLREGLGLLLAQSVGLSVALGVTVATSGTDT